VEAALRDRLRADREKSAERLTFPHTEAQRGARDCEADRAFLSASAHGGEL
jgi:hypothetical protein